MTRWFLDACSLINLYASQQLETIVTQQDSPFLVVPIVVKEAGWIYQRTGTARGEKVPIPMDTLLKTGVIEVVSPTPAMLMRFMHVVRDLDDGEAMTVAVAAETPGGGVVTDDDAALTYLQGLPTVPTSTSLALLKTLTGSLSNEELHELVLDLRICARYIPGKRHPDLIWWESLCRSRPTQQDV